MEDLVQQVCALCGQEITEDEYDFCLANRDRFNGLAFCQEHQRRFSACQAVRWQPGQR